MQQKNTFYNITENLIGRDGMLGRDLFSVDDKNSKSLTTPCFRHCWHQTEADYFRVMWYYKTWIGSFAVFNSSLMFSICSDVTKWQVIVGKKKNFSTNAKLTSKHLKETMQANYNSMTHKLMNFS